MVFDKNKKREIAQFILGNFEFGNFELFINSFAIRYLTLEATNKKDCEEYKNLKTLFDNLNRYPRMNDNNEIYWVKRKNKKNINNKEKINFQQQQFFKKKNIHQSHFHNEGEENLIKDIFFNLQKELGGLIFIFDDSNH